MVDVTRATAAALAVAFGLAGAPGAAHATGAGDLGAEVVLRALSLLGVDYRFGGNSPDTGLDCSGLVRLVFNEAVAMPLPRRSEEMSRLGDTVSAAELQPGDLVFFNTLRRAFSHVGIYIGNGQFVHAPSSGGTIRVEQLRKSYWTTRFNGARRLLPTPESPAPVLAAAQATDLPAAAGATVRRPTAAARAEPRRAMLRAAASPGRLLPVPERDYPVN